LYTISKVQAAHRAHADNREHQLILGNQLKNHSHAMLGAQR